jgi:hypothetical protein
MPERPLPVSGLFHARVADFSPVTARKTPASATF